MALEAILGGVVGGITRLVPEVMSYLDKKNERKHELSLGEQNLKLTQLQQAGQLAIADRQAEASQMVSALEAMKSGIEAQAKPTGIRWVDAFSALIRPGVTSWLFLLYALYKGTTMLMAIDSGASLAQLVPLMWTPADESMLSAVLTFWFVGRVWERASNRLER